MLVGWDGADAFKLISKEGVLNSIPIQHFCSYTLLWWYRVNDLAHVGEVRARREKATTGLLVHVEPSCQFAPLWLGDVGWCMKCKQNFGDESDTASRGSCCKM